MRVGLLIDSPADARYHVATVEALRHAADALGCDMDLRVHRTNAIPANGVGAFDGVVIGPGSPYLDESAVWDIIRGARERGVPLVGT
jgi:CTP synthase (UTP-ammonia lyase)